MRIALLTETYGRDTGYLENCLPRFLAREGAEVHVVATDLPPYHQRSETRALYADQALRPGTEEDAGDGVRLHVLRASRQLGYPRMEGLADLLRRLAPDVVQTTAAIGWIPLDAARARGAGRFRLFTGNHNAASTFPLARRRTGWSDPAYVRCMVTRFLPGRLVSLVTERCYAVTVDCAEIAVRFYGVQAEKVEVMHLGVDTGTFFPPAAGDDRERSLVRSRLGFDPRDVVCIYTGKLSEEKNALILARAVERLRATGTPVRGLFIGAGVQSEAIAATAGCTLLPFMPFEELAPYYRASDVGVWPTNESTSMLDAAACGLPLVVSDGIVYRDHVEGNGIVVRMNDLDDLVGKLSSLQAPELRRTLGSAGAQKMAESFSWAGVARRRLAAYEGAVVAGRRRTRP